MDIDPRPFTFEEDFNIIPMRQGSFMIEQGLGFSQAFSSLEQVVNFLIFQKKLYLNESISGGSAGGSGLYPNDYEPFDQTGLPKKDKE